MKVHKYCKTAGYGRMFCSIAVFTAIRQGAVKVLQFISKNCNTAKLKLFFGEYGMKVHKYCKTAGCSAVLPLLRQFGRVR